MNPQLAVAVAVGGHVTGLAEFGDQVRPDAVAAVEALRTRGWKLRLLSGDMPDVAEAVGEALGVEPTAVEGGATPERKQAVMAQLAREGTVVMVGDGVNDAAAIARATVGVAVRGGAEASLAAADVYLSRPGLDGLVQLTEGARRTLGIIRRNIGISLGYNLVGIALAMTGTITPLAAAILMPLSSVSVILLAWRGRTFVGGNPE